jgi:CheY-like chemotaxis protein
MPTTPTISHEAFVELVRQALGSLHSRASLQGHPLGETLGAPGAPLSGQELQQRLLDAVGELKPAGAESQPGPHWRRYRYVWLRYVEGSDLTRIASTLGVTDRQARRDHREALEAVAASLWTRHFGTPWLAQPQSPDDDEGEAESALNAELTRVATELPSGPTSFAETVEGALRTAARMLESRRAAVAVNISPELPAVAMNQTILRQALMSVLAYLLERAAAPRVDVRARAEDGEIVVRVGAVATSPPQVAPSPHPVPEGEERPAEGGGEGRVAVPDASTMSVTHRGASGTSPLPLGEGQGEGVPAGHGGAKPTREHVQQIDSDAADPSLELARRLVERVGGRLALSPKEPAVELRLPAARLTTVLVVDDNLDFLRLCQRSLEGRPYRVLATSLPSEALRLAKTAQPDLVLLDVLMPGHDGWDTLAQLQANPATRAIPVIVCSVFREPRLALELGAADFLPKPVTPPSLLLALERVARRADPGSPSDRPSSPPPSAHLAG